MRLRSLGVMLLAFNIMVHVAFKFSPIPFLGLAVYATSYVVTFCVFLPVLLILGSAASATIMKLAARHTPERFKHIW